MRRRPDQPGRKDREAATRQEYDTLKSNVALKLIEIEDRLRILEAEKQLLIRGRAALERAEHHDRDHNHHSHDSETGG